MISCWLSYRLKCFLWKYYGFLIGIVKALFILFLGQPYWRHAFVKVSIYQFFATVLIRECTTLFTPGTHQSCLLLDGYISRLFSEPAPNYRQYFYDSWKLDDSSGPTWSAATLRVCLGQCRRSFLRYLSKAWSGTWQTNGDVGTGFESVKSSPQLRVKKSFCLPEKNKVIG